MSEARSKMPSRGAIVAYWQSRFDDFGEEPELSERSCFACGDGLRIERAHIAKAQLGGSMGPENLHLLCRVCHAESEHFSRASYWEWLKHKRAHEWMPAFAHTAKRLKRAGIDLHQLIADVTESCGGDHKMAALKIQEVLESTVWKHE